MKSTHQILAENIKNLLQQSGLSVAEVAKRSGISGPQIYSILSQKSATKINTVEAIARVLDVHPGALITEQTDSPQQFDRGPLIPKKKMQTRDEAEFEAFLDSKQSSMIRRMEETGNALVILQGSQIEATALDMLTCDFLSADDEGKFAILRHAAAEAGKLPNLRGVKLPRDWREFAQDRFDEEAEEEANALDAIAEMEFARKHPEEYYGTGKPKKGKSTKTKTSSKSKS